MDEYLVQSRYSREGLSPSPQQCALPSLRSGWGWGRRKVAGMRGGKEVGTGIGMKMQKDNLFSFFKK